MVKTWLKTPPLYPFYRFFWQALDWLYPPACAGCDKPGSRWCKSCQAASRFPTENICPLCGDMQDNNQICPSCLDSPPPFTQLRSWGLFSGPVRQAIHRLKYQNDISLGDVLAIHLIDFYLQLGWHVDAIAPIPLHPNRLHNRGYNQSALLAFPIALKLNIPYVPKAIYRKRDTQSQVGLNKQQRLINIENAFQANPHLVRRKTFLLIDDVTTTGATMRSCADALLAAGASAVYGMTLARPAFSAQSSDIFNQS